MTYDKPVVTVVGKAVEVITTPNGKVGKPADGQVGQIHLTPAYDLDE